MRGTLPGWRLELGRAAMNTGHARWHAVVFVAGLAVSAAMVARSQVTVDQYNLLARGWRLAFQGELIHHGVWATGGGQHPGSFTSLVVGLPLLIWEHHRAPVLLILASHVLAYFLLAGTLRRILTADEQLLFAVLYWLSPWRLFFSGFLWNPNLLFICGALHLTTAYRLRENPRFWPSFSHVLVLGIAAQLHVSAVLLIASTAMLWWRRYLRLHLGAAAAAAAIVALSLGPWLLAMTEDPSRWPISTATLGHGFATAWPIVQGVMNWLRFAAVGLNRSMACLDFSGVGGPGLESLGQLPVALRLLSVPSAALALWANWRLWRRPSDTSAPSEDRDPGRCWLRGVVRWSLVGALLVFGLSPVGLTGHGLLSVIHLAVLPVVLALGSLTRVPRRKALLVGLGSYAAVMIILGVGMALGSTAYRCGGPHCETAQFTVPTLLADHPMLDDLGIRRTCPPVVDDPDGWWPDGLEASPGLASEFPSHRIDLETRKNSKPGEPISRPGRDPETTPPPDQPRSDRNQ